GRLTFFIEHSRSIPCNFPPILSRPRAGLGLDGTSSRSTTRSPSSCTRLIAPVREDGQSSTASARWPHERRGSLTDRAGSDITAVDMRRRRTTTITWALASSAALAILAPRPAHAETTLPDLLVHRT